MKQKKRLGALLSELNLYESYLLPRIFAEYRTASHKERHSVSEYIASIESGKDIITLKKDKADIENILNRATKCHSCGESAQNAYTIDNQRRENGCFP